MKKTELERVQDTVDNEGFDYTFRHYTSFDDIKDVKFHNLRLAYVAAANALDQYLGRDE